MMRLTLSLILILVLLSGSHAGWWFSGNKTKNAEKKVDVKTIQDDLQSAWSHTQKYASDKTSDAKKALEDKKKEAKGKADELKSKSKKAKDSVTRESRGLIGDIKTRFGRIFKGGDVDD